MSINNRQLSLSLKANTIRMKNLILLTIYLLIISSTYSQISKQEKDQNAIKKMCGCFEVGFNFSETFNYSDDTTYMPSKVKHANALEWAELVEDSNDKIIIQHLLVVGDKDNPMIIKHWRQDWLFENNDFYMYNGDNKWNFVKKTDDEIKGQWTQKVYQVDDSPRYEGSSSWVHVDGKSYWENTTDAPLPRREYTQRSDYNITVRRNRHEITNYGWLHDQDNDKVIRNKDSDVILAQEKGYNTYNRVDDSKCESAKIWWKKNHKFWEHARDSWNEVYNKDKNLTMHSKVDGKKLYEQLFYMDLDTSPKKIQKIIKAYIK